MDFKLILGLGTGRCGTVSLATILSEQENTRATHEFDGQYLMDWNFDATDYIGAVARLAHMAYDDQRPASIASFQLNYAARFMEDYPEAKIIVLSRKKSEVVSSFLRWTGFKNHWCENPDAPDPYDKCFPKYQDSLAKDLAIGRYWDEYYQRCEQLEAQYPYRVFWIGTEELSSEESVAEMLEFLEYENPVITTSHRNKAPGRK